MQNHAYFSQNMFEVSIFHCLWSQFFVLNAYFLVRNKHLRFYFRLISKEVSSPTVWQTNFQKNHFTNLMKIRQNYHQISVRQCKTFIGNSLIKRLRKLSKLKKWDSNSQKLPKLLRIMHHWRHGIVSGILWQLH